MKIIVFFHCYLFAGEPPDLLPNAYRVVNGQMLRLTLSGLADAAHEIIIGVNGGRESQEVMQLIAPEKSKIILHGLRSKCENPTLVLIEEWLSVNPEEAYVLYFHAKGSSHDPATDYGKFDARWREGMMVDLIDNWRACVGDLGSGAELCCSHFMRNMGHDRSQHIPAGNFLWAKASFLRTLPSIFNRDRIKVSGISSLESRYEAEVFWGNGPRLPLVKEYRPGGGNGVP